MLLKVTFHNTDTRDVNKYCNTDIYWYNRSHDFPQYLQPQRGHGHCDNALGLPLAAGGALPTEWNEGGRGGAAREEKE